MKISTKGIYGLKAMVDLALNAVNDSVTLKSVSERQNISDGYLEQIFSILSKKGLIKSKKGANGGYSLEKLPEHITVGDVLRALEGDLTVIGKDKYSNINGDVLDRCIIDNVWDKMNESINTVVNSITLKDLLEKYKKSQQQGDMYYI